MIRLIIAILLLTISLPGAAHAEADTRTVTVDGSGHVTVQPDMARLSMSVIERDPSLAAAQQAAADVTARILQLLDDLGIDRKLVSSTGATVQPNYRWNRTTEQQELIGYIAQRQIEVKILDLAHLGKVVEGAVGAGVNQVSPPVLDSTHRRDAYREALANAATDARKNAETLADTLGVTLGPVMEIDAGSNQPPPRPMMAGRAEAMVMSDSAAATYNAGDIRIDAAVSVVFSLLDK